MQSCRPAWPSLLFLLVLSGCNCGDSGHIVHVPEDFKIVPGTPTVDPNTPQVAQTGTPPPVTYGPNVPRQCDTFLQNTVRKVDILWVIQNSGSMAQHQAQLAQNFQSFISFLLSADPPIDFHIGVVSTDTDDPGESGRLHAWKNGQTSASYIACDVPVPHDPGTANHVCNTAGGVTGNPTDTVKDAFTQISVGRSDHTDDDKVGTRGSSHQRGLYASYLALNRNENLDHGNGGFIRPDAALYMVYVGSEDNLSCTPTVGAPQGSDLCRTTDAECHCADDASLSWGSTDYFVRFLKNFKGYGHGDLVSAAAVVATDKVPVPPEFGDPYPGIGCTSTDPNTGLVEAYYGKRYIDVAQAMGGVATSICSSNFNNALTALGFAVSGLRRDFKLTRGPNFNSLSDLDPSHYPGAGVFVSPADAQPCQHDPDCAGDAHCLGATCTCEQGKCAQRVKVSLAQDPTSAQYVRCENGLLRNIVSFGSNAIPPAQGTVEVCYDVDPHFVATCQ